MHKRLRGGGDVGGKRLAARWDGIFSRSHAKLVQNQNEVYKNFHCLLILRCGAGFIYRLIIDVCAIF